MSKNLSPADHLSALVSFVASKSLICSTINIAPNKLRQYTTGKKLLTQHQANSLHQLLFCNPEINPRTLWSVDAARSTPLPDYSNNPGWRVQPEHLRDYKIALMDLGAYIRNIPGTTADERLRKFMQKVAPTNKHVTTPKEWFGKSDDDSVGLYMVFPTPQMVWEIIRLGMIPQHGTDLMQIAKHPLLPTTIYTVNGQHRSYRQKGIKSVDYILNNHMAQKFSVKPALTTNPQQGISGKYTSRYQPDEDCGLPTRIKARSCAVFASYLFALANAFDPHGAYQYKGIRKPQGRLSAGHFSPPYPTVAGSLNPWTPLKKGHPVIKGIKERLGSTVKTQKELEPMFAMRSVFKPFHAEKLINAIKSMGCSEDVAAMLDYRGLCDPDNPEVEPLPTPHFDDLQFTLERDTWVWMEGDPRFPESKLQFHPSEDQTRADQTAVVQELTDEGTAPADDEPEIDPVQAEFPEMEFDDDD